MLRVRVLGDVGAWDNDVRLLVPAGKPLAILAVLALARGRTVSIDHLITCLWGDDPPSGAIRSLQVHVSTLRSRLRSAAAEVTFSPAGYHLDVGAGEIDADSFERLSRAGEAALSDDRPQLASRTLQAALDHWSGSPLGNILEAPFAAIEADRLSRRRLDVLQARIDADLALGLGATLVADAVEIVETRAYDERGCAQLMLSLYRAGRPAEALDVFSRFRRGLGEDLGLDPGGELRELERQILVHDERLLARPSERERHNLLEQLSSFVGREQEMKDVQACLRSSRLTTITGVGGAGKSRLSLKVATAVLDEFAHGVWLAELASLSDPALVEVTIARVLGVRDGDSLVDAIGMRGLLIVIDNCEHVIDACASLADMLLRRCPELKILATSREPLGVDGERLYRIPPLGVPLAEGATTDDIATSDAACLFTERAGLHGNALTIDESNASRISGICSRLDGIPLAIELAAARLRTLSVDELFERLDDRFGVLTDTGRTRPARQQTMRAVIDWSYDLLAEAERLMIDRLSVFEGGFTLDAAERVCASASEADALVLVTALLDKSMLEAHPGGPGRFRLLETIRSYAGERLEQRGAAFTASVRRAHAEYYLAVCEQAAEAIKRHDHEVDWLDRLSADHQNVRVAFTSFLARADGVDGCFRLAISLDEYWDSRGPFREAAEMVTAVLSRAESLADLHRRCLVLCIAGHTFDDLGDFASAAAVAAEASALNEVIRDPLLGAHASTVMGLAAYRQRDYRRALQLLQPTLPHIAAFKDPHLRSRYYSVLAGVMLGLGDIDNSRTVLRAYIDDTCATGDDPGRALALVNLGYVELGAGELDAATAYLIEGQALAARSHETRTVVIATHNLGLVALQASDTTGARIRFRAALGLATRVDHACMFYSLLGLAMCASADGDLATAATLHGVVDGGFDDPEAGLDPMEGRLRRRDREQLVRTLGNDEFERGLRRGRSLPLDDALALARAMSPTPIAP